MQVEIEAIDKTEKRRGSAVVLFPMAVLFCILVVPALFAFTHPRGDAAVLEHLSEIAVIPPVSGG